MVPPLEKLAKKPSWTPYAVVDKRGCRLQVVKSPGSLYSCSYYSNYSYYFIFPNMTMPSTPSPCRHNTQGTFRIVHDSIWQEKFVASAATYARWRHLINSSIAAVTVLTMPRCLQWATARTCETFSLQKHRLGQFWSHGLRSEDQLAG
jgi:hypothetical protein